MRVSRLLPLALVAAGLSPVAAPADTIHDNDGVTVEIGDTEITVSNGLVTRVFATTGFRTERIEAFGLQASGATSDVSFGIAGAQCCPWDVLPTTFEVNEIPGGLAVTRSIGVADLAQISRRDEVVAGIAGVRAQITVDLTAPVPVERYVLDSLQTTPAHAATAHAFRAGGDWRYDDGWSPVGIGDKQQGHWRSTVHGQPGEDVRAFGQWIEVSSTDPEWAAGAVVMERHNYASSRLEYDGSTGHAQAVVDLSRDIVYTGPFEETIHVESPEETAEGGRVRVLRAGQPFSFEPSWAVFGRDSDELAAQLAALLARQNGDFERRILFNTNNIDTNRISTGAKDDADFETFLEVLPIAAEAGITTFVFDDGWQAASGDWCPDSDACPEPRRDRDPVKFKARFPDDEFRAVREALDEYGMDLGLWYTPMEFHPASKAFQTNPQWACVPTGVATAAYNLALPDSSSNEAGLGVWNPLAWGVDPDDPTKPMRLIDHIESRIERSIVTYGATYFKFDFLAWVDCGGAEPVDMYEYREAFLAMLDRLIARNPDVLFSIDETNDYRNFPYESTSRGATWFANGSPTIDRALHNIWNLSPYVPGYALGQGIASNGGELNTIDINSLMASGLTSHFTVWRDLRVYSPAQIEAMGTWSAFYLDNADSLSTLTYPLLDDPLTKRWTALQPWDLQTSSGWVLAYRLSDTNESVEIPLKALGQAADGTVFDVTHVDPATESESTTQLTAAQLRAGDLVATAPINGYALYRITPA